MSIQHMIHLSSCIGVGVVDFNPIQESGDDVVGRDLVGFGIEIPENAMPEDWMCNGLDVFRKNMGGT